MRGLTSCSLLTLGLAFACGEPEPQPLASLGEPCEFGADCQEALSCIEAECVDDSGPKLEFVFPSPLDAVTIGELMFAYVRVYERASQDDLEFTFDPFGPTPMTTFLEWDEFAYPNDNGLSIPTPPEPGAHWLRARVLDADGAPYENPSATQYIMVFVRDELDPDKPLLGLLEPRPDRPHVAGTDLTYEIAVLPGSFSFSDYGTTCEPLPDCADPFAPECEAECGPISRSGYAFVYLDHDLSSCVAEQPGCANDYDGIADEQIDAVIVRGQVGAMFLPEPGAHTFSAMLFHTQGGPYPSTLAPIFVTQTFDIVSAE
jgi:hypothetical protein